MKIKFALANGAIAKKGHGAFSTLQTTPFCGVLRAVANKLPPNERVVKVARRSTRPPHAKFTDDQVRVMREMHKINGVSAGQLALLLEMRTDSVRAILIGINYSNVL